MPEPIESFSARGAELMLTSAFGTGATDDAQGWFHTHRAPGSQKGAGQDLRPPLRLSVRHGAISPNPPHAPAFLVCVRVRRERGPALSGAGLGSSGGVEGDVRILNLATNCDRDLDTAPEWLQFL